jgi:hypothetical protein
MLGGNMRTRTRDLESVTRAISGDWETQSWTTADPTNVTVNSTPIEFDETVLTGEETTNDVVTPRYLQLRSRGYIINNPYTNSKAVTETGVLVYDQDWRYRNYYSTAFTHTYGHNVPLKLTSISYIPGYLSVPEVLRDNLVSQAISAAWAKVVEAPFQSFVTAAEARKTWDMIYLSCFRLAELINRYRTRQRLLRRGFASAAKLTSLWLEMRYGVRPLVYEIQGAIEAYNTLKLPPRTRYTAMVSDVSTSSGTISWNAGNATYPSTFTMDRESSQEMVVRAGVLTREFSDKISYDRAFGMGIDQLLSGIWEVIPWSFVVDWIFNVANLLASWSPKVHQEVLTSWVVVKTENYQSRKVTNWVRGKINCGTGKYWVSPTTTTLCNSAPDVIRTSVTERIPEPDRPVIPSLNINLSVTKLIDLLALVKSVTG